MMKIVDGDLIELAKDGEFDVIVHGCNCFNHMGAGIAKSIKREFPEAYRADCKTHEGSKRKLGTYSSAEASGHDFTIVNAYTQFTWHGAKRGKVNADYRAIRNVFKKIAEEFDGLRIGYPLIGCGLAGGDWGIVSKIIDEELDGQDHTLVKFKRK